MTGSDLTCPENELLRLVPRVLRARDFHLYTEGGKRLTDLWLQGGRAILGHKAPGVVKELKNAAERGLFSSMPHPMEQRFFRVLDSFFPGRGYRLYQDESALYRALKKAGFSAGKSCFANGEVYANVCLWRPFVKAVGNKADLESDLCGDWRNASVFIPVLPLPLGPAVLVFDKDQDISFPSGDIIPPVLLAPALRSLYDLAAAIKEKKMNRGRPRYQKIDRMFSNPKSGRQKPGRQETDGIDAVEPYSGGLPGLIWRRSGIYLSVDKEIGMDKYTALFRLFLEGGFLIPPSPQDPLILPGLLSAGEEAKLADLLVKSGAVSP